MKTMATDATECANILNNYFHQQFHQAHQLASIPRKMMTDPDGVAKLLLLWNGKASGLDNLLKADVTYTSK